MQTHVLLPAGRVLLLDTHRLVSLVLRLVFSMEARLYQSIGQLVLVLSGLLIGSFVAGFYHRVGRFQSEMLVNF